VEDQYLLGRDLLVAPVLHDGQREREVWLPAGEQWIARNGECYQGGQRISVAAPLSEIPVFKREGSQVDIRAPG
jgi:alpha-D-xyloside xylohydrolase